MRAQPPWTSTHESGPFWSHLAACWPTDHPVSVHSNGHDGEGRHEDCQTGEDFHQPIIIKITSDRVLFRGLNHIFNFLTTISRLCFVTYQSVSSDPKLSTEEWQKVYYETDLSGNHCKKDKYMIQFLLYIKENPYVTEYYKIMVFVEKEYVTSGEF